METNRWGAGILMKGCTILFGVLAFGVLGSCIVGCGSKSSDRTQVQPVPQRPLRTMKSAIRRGQWQQAWELSDEVLEKHADDAEAIATVALVAHEAGKPAAAAELLAKSCRAESFRNESRNQQALIAMIGVGRLHEGMDMLEDAVEQQPQQHETRRLLYDLQMGSENRMAGVPHGRFLVRHRKFDLDLLQTLSNTERRTQENKPLEDMTSRNPSDKRPLLGDAKKKFDSGDYSESIRLLRAIVKSHPDYVPAQALLGRALATSGQFDEIERWAADLGEPVKESAGYWLAVGDWARAKGHAIAATRAYWEAARRDADVMESWSKLSTAIQQAQSAGAQFSTETVASIEERAALLSKFNQQKHRFERTGSISRAIVVDIVKTLRDLGRLWEAEAWASIALTLPEDDSIAVEQVRAEIVALLRQDTPWQLIDQHPELRVDLTRLELPPLGGVAGIVAMRESDPRMPDAKEVGETTHMRVTNEAESRGLKFFGYTSDHLDQPGIMLFETLGCGGGTIDYDLDGWSDLYLIAAGGTPPKRDSSPNALMRNMEGVFSDATAGSGAGDTGFGQGVAVGDVNADGFADLLVLNYGPNVLLVNNGDGSFTDASERLENNGNDWSTSAAIADLDGDAISDVVIVNYCAGLDPVTATCPMKDSEVFRSCTPMKFLAASDAFLQGEPNGSFQDQTELWQVKPKVLGRGLGIVAGSLDADPGVDVFVANDMTNNHFWSRIPQQHRLEFSESAMLRGLGSDDRSLAQGSMGIASGDLDGDGDVDFYVTNFDKEYNTYHQQRDAGIWQDQTLAMQLSSPTLPLVGFGSEAVDLDNDGSLELIVSNGHVDMFSRGDEQSIYAHPMQIFSRNRSGTYDSVGESFEGEYLSTPHVGRALWTLDANRDGRTDLAVTHQTEPVALLVNASDPSGHWIAFELRGRDCSRDAIGASVEVFAGEASYFLARTSGDGYLCSNEPILRQGLGQWEESCRIRVTWPDGTSQSHENLTTNRTWLITQGDEEPYDLP